MVSAAKVDEVAVIPVVYHAQRAIAPFVFWVVQHVARGVVFHQLRQRDKLPFHSDADRWWGRPIAGAQVVDE